MNVSYGDDFYAAMKDNNLASARAVTPLLMSLINPSSVIDVGCGQGLWLKAFMEQGVSDIYGVDGAWVKEDDLVIPKNRFGVRTLNQPFEVGKTADLVLSLEVAEHVPESVADSFVSALVAVAPVVLFSAAIPGQGGTHHVNEQWPEYWGERFKKHGYVPVDALRRHVWNRSDVAFFYAQNMFLFVREEVISKYPRLMEERSMGYGEVYSYVHPTLFTRTHEDATRWRLVVPYARFFPMNIIRFIKRMMKKLRS